MSQIGHFPKSKMADMMVAKRKSIAYFNITACMNIYTVFVMCIMFLVMYKGHHSNCSYATVFSKVSNEHNC